MKFIFYVPYIYYNIKTNTTVKNKRAKSGDLEIIIGSRDGRIYCLSKTGKLRWKREIGTRAWIVTIVVSGLAAPGNETSVRIIVGTRDGKVYVLDSEGRMISREGQALLFN